MRNIQRERQREEEREGGTQGEMDVSLGKLFLQCELGVSVCHSGEGHP